MRALRTLPNSRAFESEAEFCESHGLELEHASDYGWIVRTANTRHFGNIVGCIDQLDGSVELMKLNGGFHWSSFVTLQDALNDLAFGLASEPAVEAVAPVAVRA